MSTKDEYEARKAEQRARWARARNEEKIAANAAQAAIREAELGGIRFFKHPDRTVRYTGWLQLYTFALFAATLLLFGASVVTAIVLHNTDEKIGNQATSTHDLATAAIDHAKAAKEAAEGIKGQLAVMQGQLAEMQRQSEFTITQLKPKLTLSFKGPNRPMIIEGKEGWIITPNWDNRGGSEGIEFWGWDNARLFTPDAPADFDFLTFGRDTGAISKTTIGVNEWRLQMSRFISRDDVKNVIGNKEKFIFWGYIEYRESLPGNQPHHIHWCYETAPVDAGDSYIFARPLYRAECNSSD
jgi:hypothetical protein